MLRTLHSCVTGLALLAATCATASAHNYTSVVTFGDSLSDRGNTVNTFRTILGEELAGVVLDYDNVYYHHSDPAAHGIPPHGRFSSGPTWVEYLNAKILGGASASTPVDLGANLGFSTTETGRNYAWGGSLSGPATESFNISDNLPAGVTLPPGYTGPEEIVIHNLLHQINSYANNTEMPNIGSTLFTVWTGGNDALGWIKDANRGDLDTLTTAVIANIAQGVEELIALGGRGFVLPNLPALGYKPDFINDEEKRTLANQFVASYNSKLAAWIDTVDPEDATIYELDVYGFFEDMRLNPEKYGLINTSEAAYTYLPGEASLVAPGAENFVFWDTTHPTARVHEILGNLAFHAIPEPSTYALVVGGGAMALWLRRNRRAA